MYNLFISSNKDAWEGEPFILELDRFCEYTDTQITKRYGDLSDSASISEIMRMPCIFAYERQCQKDPKFGLIREITKRQGKVRVNYEVIELERFLTHAEVEDILFDLDIDSREMNRTHWAIKNVNISKELSKKSIGLPFGISRDSKAVDISIHQFDVALSFPGEVRFLVEKIVTELEREIGPNSYFYDNNYKAQLARPNLDSLLQDIYGNRSKLIVVFLCKKYDEKEWCGIEFRPIREIIKNKESDRIMFIKIDGGKVEGVFGIDGYVDGNKHTPQELAVFIKERIGLLSAKEPKEL